MAEPTYRQIADGLRSKIETGTSAVSRHQEMLRPDDRSSGQASHSGAKIPADHAILAIPTFGTMGLIPHIQDRQTEKAQIFHVYGMTQLRPPAALVPWRAHG
jgi:hypothetical protein